HALIRQRVLHGRDEHVADLGVGPRRRAEHADHRDLTRSAVVRDAKPGVRTDHGACASSASCFSSLGFCRISVTPSASSSIFSMSAAFGAAAAASPARLRTSTTFQRFVALYGRLSWMRTRSPSRTSPASSWAAKPLRRRTTFLYTGCLRMRPAVTMT